MTEECDLPFHINSYEFDETKEVMVRLISHKEWDEYVEIALERNLSSKNINILKTANRKAGIAKYLSPKIINWVLSLVDQLDEGPEDEEE